MNYTTNYHLPQWVESDRIMMEDFNEAMSDIDGGIAAAQAAADTAQETAETLPFVVGSYSGNGSTRTITLGFRPSMVIIYQEVGSSTAGKLGGDHFMISTGTTYRDKVSFTDNGFTVAISSSIPYPQVNGNFFSYVYIAFR